MSNAQETVTGQHRYSIKGLIKREHFAGLAMQGLLANSQPHSWGKEQYVTMTAKQSVEFADALLKELAK